MIISNEEAKDLMVRCIKGDQLCETEIDAFDDWKFENSTSDVVKLIQEAGKKYRETIKHFA